MGKRKPFFVNNNCQYVIPISPKPYDITRPVDWTLPQVWVIYRIRLSIQTRLSENRFSVRFVNLQQFMFEVAENGWRWQYAAESLFLNSSHHVCNIILNFLWNYSKKSCLQKSWLCNIFFIFTCMYLLYNHFIYTRKKVMTPSHISHAKKAMIGIVKQFYCHTP